ncbi:MAG: hypothetical protein QM760_20325 [Nibricoccus sp.]
MKLSHGRLCPALLREQKEKLQVRIIPRIQVQEIELAHQLLIDRLHENHLVDPPLRPVRQHHPIDTLIGGACE